MLVSQCFNSVEINNTSTGAQISRQISCYTASKTEHTRSFRVALDYVGVHSEAYTQKTSL